MIPGNDAPYDVCASAAQWVDSFNAMVDRINASTKYKAEEKPEKIRQLRAANDAALDKLPDNLKALVA